MRHCTRTRATERCNGSLTCSSMVTCSSMANRTKVIYLSEGNPSRDRSCYVVPVAIRAPAHIIETDQGTYIVQGNPVSEHSSLSPDESLVEIPSSGNDEGQVRRLPNKKRRGQSESAVDHAAQLQAQAGLSGAEASGVSG